MTAGRIPADVRAAEVALLAGHVTDDEYRERADRHRPAVSGLRSEAQRLVASGLSVRDVAQALRVQEDVVRNWLAERAP